MLVAEPSPNEMRDPEMRRELKRDASTSSIRIVLLTGIVTWAIRRMGLASVASGWRMWGRADTLVASRTALT